MKRTFLTISAVMALSALLPATVQAAELLFTWSSNGNILETFELNTNSGELDSVPGYVYYPITNDSIAGNDGAYFGGAAQNGLSGSGSSCGPRVCFALNYDYFAPAPYSGSGTFIAFTPGESFGPGSQNGFVLSISAVPEAATWVLMIAGFGGLGAALRTRHRMATTAV
jgi:hypothetical protein